MRGISDSDDYSANSDKKGINTNKITSYREPITDSQQGRGVKQLQGEIDQLKLENYHLREEVQQYMMTNMGQSKESKIHQLQSENEQLKMELKKTNNQSSQDKYHRALKQISRLYKFNKELTAELQYIRANGLKDQSNQQQLRKYEQQIVYLQQENQQLSYRLNENVRQGNKGNDEQLSNLRNRLKEKQYDIQELQNVIQQSQRKYNATNAHFQILIEQNQQIKAKLQEQHRRKQLQLQQELQQAHNNLRSNQRQLEQIKTNAGYFNAQIQQLKDQVLQLEAINEELKRQVNREQSIVSQSSAVGELQTHINSLNNEMDSLKQFNLAKDTNDLLAENQMLERQVLNLNNRNSIIEKQMAELRINIQQYTRKFESIKSKHEVLVQSNSQLQANYSKKQQKLIKLQRDNELMREKMLHPGVRKAIADVEVAQDIDIQELKVKVRNSILILELILNDSSEPLGPKQVQTQDLHSLKILLLEIDIKIKTLIEDNNSMKKTVIDNKQIIQQLQDINSRLTTQTQSYEQLIHRLQEQFERSITRNQKIEQNITKQFQQQIYNMQQQFSIQVKHLKQEIQTKVLDYEVKLTMTTTNYKKSQLSLHNAYQQKQQQLNTRLKQIESAHSQAIRQLRILGPEKQQTIARLYSSIHDLELELKLYKNNNEIADKNINQLIESVKEKTQSNEVLQNNIKVILSSQGQNIQALHDYKLKQKDYIIKLEGLTNEVQQLTEKNKALQSMNMQLQSQLHITQQQAAQFYQRNQNIMNDLNSKSNEFKNSKTQNITQIAILQKRLQSVSLQRQQLESLRLKQQKQHNNELALFKKNYQQKLDLVQRNYQDSTKLSRSLQQRVDDLTIINIQLYNDLKKYESNSEIVNKIQEIESNSVYVPLSMSQDNFQRLR